MLKSDSSRLNSNLYTDQSNLATSCLSGGNETTASLVNRSKTEREKGEREKPVLGIDEAGGETFDAVDDGLTTEIPYSASASGEHLIRDQIEPTLARRFESVSDAIDLELTDIVVLV